MDVHVTKEICETCDGDRSENLESARSKERADRDRRARVADGADDSARTSEVERARESKSSVDRGSTLDGEGVCEERMTRAKVHNILERGLDREE